LHVAAVEPAESAVLSDSRADRQDRGIGIGFVPPLWEPDEVDEIIAVTTADAKAMTRRLALEEVCSPVPPRVRTWWPPFGLAGVSAGRDGSNHPGRFGLRYLSTDVFRT